MVISKKSVNGRIKLVIFDLDGTLIDAYSAIARSFNYTMKQMKYPAQDTLTIRRKVGWGDRQLLSPFIREEDLAKALLIFRRHHKKAIKIGTRFLPGAGRLLRTLKKSGMKLAVATNRPSPSAKGIIRYLDLKKFFDYVLCGDKIEKPKPHPDMLHQILKKFKISHLEAVYVGDMTIDVEAGNRAKVKTVAVATGSSSRKEIKRFKPYRIVPKLDSVMSILKNLEGNLF